MLRNHTLAALLVSAASFTAAEQGSSCLGSGTRSGGVAQSGISWPWQTFQTAPYNPPHFEIEYSGKPLAPGLLFFGPSNFVLTIPPATKQPAPFIMTTTNDLVWSGPDANTTNFRVQTLNGKPVLTYWEGYSTQGGNIGHGYGAVHILNQKYETIHVVNPKLGLNVQPPGQYPGDLDLHESYITERNTLIATAYNITQADLSSVGGPKNGWINDCQFYEIDIATQKVLFHWSSIEHVPITASHQPRGTSGTNSSAAWDYFHINAVQSVGENYLVNGRHTWSTYMVGPKGNIIWTIQGEHGGDFGPLPAGTGFEWQHHARVHHVTDTSIELTWFDNRNSEVDNGTHPTQALSLQLTLPPNPKTPPKRTTNLLNTPPLYVDSQGSYQRLPCGHQFMGFGQIPLMREYGPASTNPGDSNTLWTARFGNDSLVQSYRAYKQEWHATPCTEPALKIKAPASGKCGQGFVSWNGATDITSWNVYEGESKQNLTKSGSVGKHGFETAFGISKACVQVGAVRGGDEISRSAIECSATGYPA